MTELRAPSVPLEDFKYGILPYCLSDGSRVEAEVIIRWPAYDTDGHESNDGTIKDMRCDALNTQMEAIYTELWNQGCKVNPGDFRPYRKGVPW